MRIISVLNQKGGCGKTTTSVNLAATLAARGRRVMLVDLDPQSHCAAAFGVPEKEIEFSTIDLLLDPPSEAMGPSRIAACTWEVAFGLRLLPSTVRLARAEAPGGGLMDAPDRDRRLSRGLSVFADALDYCFVDCPPTIGMLTFNALRAADEILVPVETGFLATRGAERQWATLRAMAERLGRAMHVRLVPNLLRPERALDRDLLQGLREQFGEGVSPHPIRDHLDIREATAFGRAVLEHSPESPAVEDYQQLADWLETSPPAEIAPPEVGHGVAGGGESADAVGDSFSNRVEVSARAAELVRRMRPDEAVNTPAAGSVGHATGGGAPPAVVGGVLRLAQPASIGRAITVVGDFNSWTGDGLALVPRPDLDSSHVGIEIPLAGGTRYRFIVDGRPLLDASNPAVVEGPDGHPANVAMPAVPDSAGIR